MYKILIVDDEKWIRKGIISKLEYLNFKFAWTGEAENGEEAVALIRQELPQIVITDVKMPTMDGIQLIKTIRESAPKVKFVIISGYAEFEYAEQALNMDVIRYILKPVSEESLNETMQKVIRHLDEEHEAEKLKEKNSILEKDNENFLFERAVNYIFHDHDSKLDENEKAGIWLWPSWFNAKCKQMLVLIHIDSSNYSSSTFKYNDLDGIKLSIKKIIEGKAEDFNVIVMDNTKDISQLIVLLPHSEETALRKSCDTFVLEAYARITGILGLSVTIAVSGIENGITGELYKQARTAFDMRLVNGSNRIYKYYDIKTNEKNDPPEHKLRLFEKCIENYDFQNVYDILNDMFSAENLSGTSRNYIQYLFFEIARIILKHSGRLYSEKDDSLDSGFLSGEILDDFDNSEQIASYIYTTVIDVFNGNPVMNMNCKEIICKVKDYMLKNYGEEITVKKLALKYAINPNYFSTVFRQETGVTLTKFLMDSRIEKACQLLKKTNVAINDIAQIVGYQDVKYFYRVFKKTTGKTPLEYRNQV